MSISDWVKFIQEGWQVVHDSPFPFVFLCTLVGLIVWWANRRILTLAKQERDGARQERDVARQERDFAIRQKDAAELELTKARSELGASPKSKIGTIPLNPATPKVLVRHNDGPRATFTFSNDGNARALNVTVDPLRNGRYGLSFPIILQIAESKEHGVMPSVAPDRGIDTHYVADFWNSLPPNGALPFLVRYSDVEGRTFLTEYSWQWRADSVPLLVFQRWAQTNR